VIAVRAVLIATLLLGCSRPSEFALADTEGRQIVASCDKKLACRLAQRAGPREAAPKSELVLYAPGKVVGVCAVAPEQKPESPSDCRPLACRADTNCPPAHGIAHGTCLKGLCVEPAQTTATVEDAVMLCLAGSGLGRTTQLQTERYALAVNCGSPCKVPALCRQPE
jgi:hypothetical protein